MNAPIPTPDRSSTLAQVPRPRTQAKFRAGSVDLNGRGMLFGGTLVTVGLVFVLAILKAVFGFVLGLFTLLAWALGAAVGLLGLVVTGALGLGAMEQVRQQRRHRALHVQLLESGTLPRSRVIRGQDPPQSRLEAALAVVFQAYADEQELDLRTLSDLSILHHRASFARFRGQAPYASVLESEYYRPVFQLAAVQRNPFVLEQIERYAQLRRRVAFWQLRRILHVLSAGRFECTAEQSWQSRSAQQVLGDYSLFCQWASVEGQAVMAELEPLIEARALELDSSQPGNAASREARQAQDLIEGVEHMLEHPEPWIEPQQTLEQMHEALVQAKTLAPSSPQVQDLAERVAHMQLRLPGFSAAYQAALACDPEQEPAWMSQAYEQASVDLTQESLQGHAVRLYLAQEEQATEANDARAPREPQAQEPAGESQAQPSDADPQDCDCDAPIDPHAAAHARRDF